jgi:hypothetical protein
MEKMSDVPESLVEPYREADATESSFRKLLALAVTAWDASFPPLEVQKAMCDEVLLKSRMPDSDFHFARAFLQELIDRKNRHYVKWGMRLAIDRRVVERSLNAGGGQAAVWIGSFPCDLGGFTGFADDHARRSP